jgi:hypothetical protein
MYTKEDVSALVDEVKKLDLGKSDLGPLEFSEGRFGLEVDLYDPVSGQIVTICQPARRDVAQPEIFLTPFEVAREVASLRRGRIHQDRAAGIVPPANEQVGKAQQDAARAHRSAVRAKEVSDRSPTPENLAAAGKAQETADKSQDALNKATEEVRVEGVKKEDARVAAAKKAETDGRPLRPGDANYVAPAAARPDLTEGQRQAQRQARPIDGTYPQRQAQTEAEVEAQRRSDGTRPQPEPRLEPGVSQPQPAQPYRPAGVAFPSDPTG